MASTLPAFVDCSSNVHQTFRSSWLDPVELASAMEIPGDFVLAHNERQLGKPHVVGFFNVVSPSNDAREWALGQALTLRGSQDVKRLLERKEVRGIIWVTLLREEKNRAFSEFKWVRQSQLSTTVKSDLWWPVFSLDWVARSVRSTAFAPGDLYLDDRAGLVVRQLSGKEKWRLMQLPDSQMDWLVANNLESQLGKLAGNSITLGMSTKVMKQEASRIKDYLDLDSCLAANTFTNMRCFPALGGNSVCVLLAIVSLHEGSLAVFEDETVPGIVGVFDQKSAYKQACNWAQSLQLEHAAESCLVLEKPANSSRIFAVVYFLQVDADSLRVQGLTAVKVVNLRSDDFTQLGTEALSLVERHARAVKWRPNHSGWCTGRMQGDAAYERTELAPSVEQSKAFSQWMQLHYKDKEKLRRLLEQDGSQHMLDWRAKLGDEPLDEVPLSLQSRPALDNWSRLVIPDPHVAELTQWECLPAPVHLAKRPAPQGWLTAVRPPYRRDAASLVQGFLASMTEWMFGNGIRPAAEVIPGDWLEHWVFEAPHDFWSEPGWAVPLDCASVPPSHLNLDFFKAQGEGYSDQEMISYLLEGVRYKADLPVQIVLQPHLFSFLAVQEKWIKESDRFIERGWSVVSSAIPLVPFFSASLGSVERPLEPGRPRAINDGGQPRKELWAGDGFRVRSINEVVSESHWPKESKPRALHVMMAMTVLLEASLITDLTVFVITSDYASFFNQMRLAVSEYCKTGVIHPPRKGQSMAQFGYDTVLGFGISMGSNIAQRFADFLVTIFKRKILPVMDKAAEDLAAKCVAFADWWDHRKALGKHQAFLVTMFMYTDDPCILCLGPDMTYEALKAWNWMACESNTMMAIMEKSSLGMSAKWIGVKFFVSFGVSVLTAQKVLRAPAGISAACCGSMNFDQYRSLVGFLEHARDVLFLRGDKMYGIYHPFRTADHASSPITLGKLQKDKLAWWRCRLLEQCGSSVAGIQAFVSGAKIPAIVRSKVISLAIFSDAAKEGTTHPGLGAWICGMIWRIDLTPDLLCLDIPVLENIAAVVNVMVLHRLLGGVEFLPEGMEVQLHVDAEATAHILSSGRTKASIMQAVHEWALQQQSFRDMLPFLRVMHIFGLANVASDAVSRGYFGVVNRVATAVGVKVRRLPDPQEALDLLGLALKRREDDPLRTKAPERILLWGSRGVRIGEASHPGPKKFVVFKKPGTSSKKSYSRKSNIAKPKGRRTAAVSVPKARAEMLNIACPDALAKALCRDNTDQAICGGDYGQMLTCCEVAIEAADSAFALKTAKQDVSNWRAWKKYCSVMKTKPMRAPVNPQTDRVGYLREVVLLVNALVYFIKNKQPKSFADRKSGKTIRPQSAMNILLGVNRVLKRNYSSLIPLKAIALALKGMMRKFIVKFGPTSLVPKRREAFTNGMINLMLSDQLQGKTLGPFGLLDWKALTGKLLRLAFSIAVAAGFRKAELFYSDEETCCLTWELLTWHINGKTHKKPSRDMLNNLKEGDYLLITPPPSKSDPFNTVWGALPVYLAFHEATRNAAAALREVMLQRGPDNCRSGRVFEINGKPWTCALMASTMYHWVSCVIPAASATLFTWHSCRIFLACALACAKPPCKPAVIQALLRWQTEESLRLYSRMGMHMYANLVDSSVDAQISSVQTTNLPLYEKFHLFVALNATVEEMEA